MGFLGVYKAIYDYAPQAAGELAIAEGDLLFILDNKGDDGWWKAKKKAGAEDEDEPEGLIPNNYVEEAPVLNRARALYEYTRQTDEELSFHEDATLEILDISDPDWILAGLDNEFGFVPSNYIEMSDAANGAASPADDDDDDDDPLATPPPSLPTRPQAPETSATESPRGSRIPSQSGPAAALAGVLSGRAPTAPTAATDDYRSRPSPDEYDYDDDEPPPQPPRQSDELRDFNIPTEPVSSPTLPTRPRISSAQYAGGHSSDEGNFANPKTPGGSHMYNINEMVSVMGKRKKMPTTLGINLGSGMILIAPEKASDGASQEWSADRMTHYSREGKHVFLELVRPSKSIDFHAGAKDTAEEIVSALGEMAGAIRAAGLREVIAAGTGKKQRKGVCLYDFMAQGDDEVTVAVGDEVIILDDAKSEEWWQIRRLKNGTEGVVPSSYIEITGAITPPPSSEQSLRSRVESNRQEEVRLTKEALKASKSQDKRSRRENGRADADSNGQVKSKSKPDSAKVRVWTDRSKSFSVEAQFLGLKDGKLHLHKLNGVKIAVPITKMSHEDLEYVESMTGISLDDERPLADMRKSKASDKKELRGSSASAAASVSKDPKKPEYDWFQFFLGCDIAVGLCDRYARAFTSDSMDESVLPDVDAPVLRNLGLREGDIIKVMRFLDNKYGRKKSEPEGEGGLFSGPGGALRNNTRKGRPAPAVQTSDTIDAAAFSNNKEPATTSRSNSVASPPPSASPVPPTARFDDDAWDVKPSSKPQAPAAERTRSPPAAKAATPPPPAPQLTGSAADLSLLTQPLQPTKTAATTPSPPAQSSQPLPQSSSPVGASVSPPPPQQGATPSFFSTVPSNIAAQITRARQRPLPPAQTGNSAGLMPSLPSRPLSAPQSAQQAFAPPALAPQMTGLLQGQPAAPGQSLHDLTQARLQQQYTAQMQQPMMTGFQQQGMNSFPNGQQQQQQPQPFMQQPLQPAMTGMPGASPFADPRASQYAPLQTQPTGYQPGFQSFGQQPQQGPVNNYLPPALEPQRTGIPPMQPQPTGMTGFNPQQQQQPPPAQPLVPQKTGPPPPVRFGVTNETNKLVPQPTGRRANLSQATPQNPFGF